MCKDGVRHDPIILVCPGISNIISVYALKGTLILVILIVAFIVY